MNYPKIGVKLGIGLVILALVMANLRKPTLSDAMYYLIMMLTVVNIGVAVFWSSCTGSSLGSVGRGALAPRRPTRHLRAGTPDPSRVR